MAEYSPGYRDEYTHPRPRVCSSRSSMTLFSEQRHRLAEYYFAVCTAWFEHPRKFPRTFPCKYPSVFEISRMEGFSLGRILWTSLLVPVPGKILGHGTGLLHTIPALTGTPILCPKLDAHSASKDCSHHTQGPLTRGFPQEPYIQITNPQFHGQVLNVRAYPTCRVFLARRLIQIPASITAKSQAFMQICGDIFLYPYVSEIPDHGTRWLHLLLFRS